MEWTEDNTTNNGYDLAVDSRKMVFYRWVLERECFLFRTRLVQHFRRLWWIVGVRNVRASLFPLHAEMEALLWAMECVKNLRQLQVMLATDCSQLVNMVSEPEEWLAFANYLEDVKILKECFTRSKIIYVPRTQNSKTDRLARSVRKVPSFVVHMDEDHPVWFTESVWVCILLMTKQKN